MSENHHWITLHRLKLSDPRGGAASPYDLPPGGVVLRCLPELSLGDDGLPEWRSDTWGVLAVFDNRASAETMFEDPVAFLPDLGVVTETWSALAIPVASHGEVNWRGDAEEGLLACRSGLRDGSLAVVTTAGYTSRDAGQLPRIRQFMAGIIKVVEFYGTLPGNDARAVFSGGLDGRDGFTLSIWSDDRAMIAGAYKSGAHRAEMDLHEDNALFDRSSFSRLRIIESAGTWDGRDLAA